MKKILAISLVLYSAMTTGLLLKGRGIPAEAAGGGGVPVGNGDVNGDGAINISDAIYLLSSLFLGGSDPVAIECPQPAGKGLPATGQWKCYDASGAEIACDNPDFPGQDGLYHAGCPNVARFVDNGDGTLTDTCTGLMWQGGTADVNADGRVQVDEDLDQATWGEALAYCANLTLAGHHDWRLPNVRELQSIAAYGTPGRGSQYPVIAILPGSHWTSSSVEQLPQFAWYVGDWHRPTYLPVVYEMDKTAHLWIVAVRGAQ